VAFEDLYWMQTSLIINSTEACYSDVGLYTGRRLQRRRMGDRRQGRPLAVWWGGVRGVGVTTDE